MRTFEIILLQAAQADTLQHFTRFGETFSHQLDRALELLASNPELGTRFRANYRRFLIRHTPLGVFYTVSGSRILVGAIVDLRQDPGRILDLLPNTPEGS